MPFLSGVISFNDTSSWTDLLGLPKLVLRRERGGNQRSTRLVFCSNVTVFSSCFLE